MTRVNLQHSRTLCDKHNFAEFREIKRIPNTILSGKLTPRPATSHFVLGTGHVKFFTNKLLWLFRRYNQAYAEARLRGVDATYMWPLHGIEQFKAAGLWNDWQPSQDEESVSVARITERMPKKARWTKRNIDRR